MNPRNCIHIFCFQCDENAQSWRSAKVVHDFSRQKHRKMAMSAARGASSLATAFGVRGLDPALAFGGTSVVSRATVRRCFACDIRSPLDAQSRERKSGVKPLALPTSLTRKRTGGPKVRKCDSLGSARNERSPGFRWTRDAALKGRDYRVLPVVSRPFRAHSSARTGPRAALVPRFPWAITLPGFQPYICPTVQQRSQRLVGNAGVKPPPSKASRRLHGALVSGWLFSVWCNQPGGLLDRSRGLSEPKRAIPPDSASAGCTPDGVLERSHVGSQSPRLHHPCRGVGRSSTIRGYRSFLAQPPATVWLPLRGNRVNMRLKGDW